MNRDFPGRLRAPKKDQSKADVLAKPSASDTLSRASLVEPDLSVNSLVRDHRFLQFKELTDTAYEQARVINFCKIALYNYYRRNFPTCPKLIFFIALFRLSTPYATFRDFMNLPN